MTHRDCDTKGVVLNGLVSFRTLWHIGYVTQRADLPPRELITRDWWHTMISVERCVKINAGVRFRQEICSIVTMGRRQPRPNL